MLQFDHPTLGTTLAADTGDEPVNNNNNNINNKRKKAVPSSLQLSSPEVAAPAPPQAVPVTPGDSQTYGMSCPSTGSMSNSGTGSGSSIVSLTPGGAEHPANNGGGAVVKQCAGCGAKILDRFLLHAMERYWHTGCLKCTCCQAQLGEIGSTCFAKSGMILCKNDYIRLFGSSGMCATCNQCIPASEFVMRAQNNVYHMNCFTCVACHSRLVPGDRFSLVNGNLICEHDYPKFARGHASVPLRSSHKVC